MVGIEEMFTVRVFAAIQMPAHLLGAACGNIVQCPTVARQHVGAEALDVIRSVAAEYIRQLDHGASKIGHQPMDGIHCHGFGFFSQMRVDAGRGRGAVTQPDLDQTQVDAGFEQMRGPGMPIMPNSA